jgi:hypothetical protein
LADFPDEFNPGKNLGMRCPSFLTGGDNFNENLEADRFGRAAGPVVTGLIPELARHLVFSQRDGISCRQTRAEKDLPFIIGQVGFRVLESAAPRLGIIGLKDLQPLIPVESQGSGDEKLVFHLAGVDMPAFFDPDPEGDFEFFARMDGAPGDEHFDLDQLLFRLEKRPDKD